jgi:hypothetical protein
MKKSYLNSNKKRSSTVEIAPLNFYDRKKEIYSYEFMPYL